MAIKLTGHIVVSQNDVPMIEAEMKHHIANTQAEPGCLVFRIEKIHNQPGHYSVYEIFNDQAAFDHHQQRVKESKWGRITQNVERHYVIEDL